MYLISIYFDEKTNSILNRLTVHVAEATGNHFMRENQIPSHITVAAVDAEDEKQLIAAMERVSLQFTPGEIQWVSVGTFVPQVLFIEPVLNQYLHDLSVQIAKELGEIPGVVLRENYQPFSWLPHCSVGKRLTKEQMMAGYEVLLQEFQPFQGMVTKIGVAKTNPHRDVWGKDTTLFI